MFDLESLIQALRHQGIQSLTGIRRGMEKEALRITPTGHLAQTPHPPALGSALTHSHITTDFSESLLEFITPPCDDIDSMFSCMDQIHRFTCQILQQQDELLWMSSMPCIIEDDRIPIAVYGTSNVARMKHIYRVGLAHRYGRSMQAISGIHYNLSFPDIFWQTLQQIEKNSLSFQDYKTEKYFGLIRNFRRYFWLMLYLFGAAPAACASFVRNRSHHLQPLDQNSFHHPYATSLRMGDLGYQSKAQESLYIDYNSLNGYISSLLQGLTTPHPDYEKIGLKDGDQYKQLSTHLLQIENEFYSVIRPKYPTQAREAPLTALNRHGVEYIEVRSVDVNLYNPIGLDKHQAYFIEAFLLFCLLEESPPTDTQEYRHILHNQHEVVNRGRDPEVQVYCHGRQIPLRQCAEHWLKKIECCAELLSESLQDENYYTSVIRQEDKLSHPDQTPSGKIIQQMQQEHLSFYQLALQQSRHHFQSFIRHPLNDEPLSFYRELARQSLAKQQQIEASDTESFDEYLDAYFRQYRRLEQVV
jgi:glutamate--cysteine ligase